MRLSSSSVHQCGYGLVLAWTSVIRAEAEELILFFLDEGFGGVDCEVERDGVIGSTCTISSQS